MLAAACGTDAGASLGCYAGTRQPSTPPAGVVWSIGMGSPTASTPPPPAASATTVAAAPTVKKMPTAPRTRVVDFVHLPVGADGELAAVPEIGALPRRRVKSSHSCSSPSLPFSLV